MAIPSIALSAYQNALSQAGRIDSKVGRAMSSTTAPSTAPSFSETLVDSLSKVNAMQNQKTDMVEAFAAGKTQNVHELMINLQKAGLTMQMTTAVRGKVLEAYKELVKMQF